MAYNKEYCITLAVMAQPETFLFRGRSLIAALFIVSEWSFQRGIGIIIHPTLLFMGTIHNLPLQKMKLSASIIVIFASIIIRSTSLNHEEIRREIRPMLKYIHFQPNPLIMCHNSTKDVFKTSPRAVRISRHDLSDFHYEAVFCVKNPEELNKLYVESDEFRPTKRKSWLIILLNDYETNRIDLKIDIDKRVFFYNRRNLSLHELYTINEYRISRLLGSIIPVRNGAKHVYKRVEKHPFLKRRSNFWGQNLAAVVEDQQPFIMFKPYIVPKAIDSNHYSLETLDVTYGLFYDVLKLMKKSLNFTTTLTRRFDGNWGKKDKNGTWNGMVKSLLDGEADLIATSLTVNKDRYEAVDFLFPIGKESYAIYIGNPDQADIDWNIYRYPFSNVSWICMFCSVFVLAALLFGTEYLFIRRGLSNHEMHPLQFLTYSWLVFASFFGGKPSWSKIPPKLDYWFPWRWILFGIFLTGNFIFMFYRASITSELAVWSIRMPFDTLQGLLDNGEYKLITTKGGILQSYFEDAEEGTILHDIYRNLMRDEDRPFVSEIEDGIKRVLDQHGSMAFFYTLEGIGAYPKYRCKIVSAWTTQFPGLLAFALPKESPFYAIFYHAFLASLENGALRIAQTRWASTALSDTSNCAQREVTGLGFEKIMTIFLIPLCGSILAVLILFGERSTKAESASQDEIRGKNEKFLFSAVENILDSLDSRTDQEMLKTLAGRIVKRADKTVSIRVKGNGNNKQHLSS